MGDRERNELNFTMGSLVTNVQNKSAEWAIGDHRGDKQKYFRPDHIQLLTRDELAYINDLVRYLEISLCDDDGVCVCVIG